MNDKSLNKSVKYDMNKRRKQSLRDAKMLFTSKELAFAAGASSPNLFLNTVGRYDFRITAERRVRGANYYTAQNLGKAYLIGALESQMIPTSHIPKLFNRIDWDAYALANDKMANHELDDFTLYSQLLSRKKNSAVF